MPRPTVADAQGREAIYDAPPFAPAPASPSERPPREERIHRKTYHLPVELIRRVADEAKPGLTQSQVVSAALRRYFELDGNET